MLAACHWPAEFVAGEEFNDGFGVRRQIAKMFVEHEHEVDAVRFVEG
jgi:hypothetical protein